MDNIRAVQARKTSPLKGELPRHQPEMLYIGCIDARLDPIDDIGIEKGKALIFRNIGALVLKDGSGDTSVKASDISTDGEIPQSVSVGAALEFFLNHIPLESGKKKHIVVSGHTDCGGLKACQHQGCKEGDHYLPLYLQNLSGVRQKVMQDAEAHAWTPEETLHALERESVRQSMANLIQYPAVRREIDAGRLEVHGWVIDTATQRIAEMNNGTKEFEPMA